MNTKLTSFLNWFNSRGDHTPSQIEEYYHCNMHGKTGSGQTLIRTHKNYNGSGEQAFGGAKEWMHIEVFIALPVETPQADGETLLHDIRMLLNANGYS